MSYDVFADFYDRLTANVDYVHMAQFLRGVILRHKPDCSLVLDLACGTGTLTNELQRLGFDMTGVDSSCDMLGKAREKSDSAILYLCQPMERLDLYGTVGAVVCTLDCVNHVNSRRRLQEIFRRVALFLDPDGVFIFDANTEYKHRCVLADNTFVYDLDDIYCVWQNETDSALKTSVTLDFFVRDNGAYLRSGESFCETAYSSELIAEMLGECGMKIAEQYDDYSDSPPSDRTERIVYVCRKNN